MKRLLLSAATMACVHISFSQKAATSHTIDTIPVSKELEEVEVTSTGNRKLLYQPVSISKLTARELQRSTGLFLDDAINANVPGVQMQRRAISSGQTINIRGYGNGVRGANGASSNFDIQGVKVYLNGIPITDAEGITTLDDIDFGSVAGATVIKGPAGTVYGQAIAGAVNLFTTRAEPGKTSIGQQVLLGSNGLERYTTTFQRGGEHSSILLNYGHQESKGYMPHNASQKDFVNFIGEFQSNAKQSVSTYFGFSNSYDQRAGELTIAQYQNSDFSGNPAYIKNDAHSHVLSVRAGITHTYLFNERFSNSTTLFGAGITNDASSAGGWTDKTPVNFGARSAFNMKFALGRHVLLSGVSGFESLQQRQQTIGYAMGADPRAPNGYNRISRVNSDVATRTAANNVFTEWTASLPQDLSLTAGIGWSSVQLQLTDRLFGVNAATVNSPTSDVFRKQYDGMWSPRVALNKVFGKHISAYVSWSRGYKAPVTSYFYIPYVAGSPGTGQVNPNLKPEKGDQLEVGTKGTLLRGRLRYELALFHTEFLNKMSAENVTNGTATLYSYVVNSGTQEHNGVEVSVSGDAYRSETGFFRTIAPFANLTYSDFKYRGFVFKGTNYYGNKIAGVPPLVYNVGLDVFTGPGLYLNACYSYRDAVFITSANKDEEKAGSFGLLNAKLGFRRALGAHFDLDAHVGASNLGNEQHYLMIFINQLPDAFIPAPLKTQWFGGINLKYIF
jgi:iron complex outermembrane receptor protein